jgi:hypothetical protein
LGTSKRIRYANVPVALFLVIVLGGGSGYAADKLNSTDAKRAEVASAQRASCPHGTRRPKVIQLSYSRWYEGESLIAFARRTHRLRFRTGYQGETKIAPARRATVADADLKGHYSSWKPNRKEGGKRVIRDVRRELKHRGVARLHTVAKRCGRTDKHLWRIVLAKCSQDPPLYPVDCEVARSGRQFRPIAARTPRPSR